MRFVAAVTLGAFVVSACGQQAPSATAEGEGKGRLVVAHTSDAGGGMEAIVAGVVEVDLERGCVWLSQPDGSRYPVVWPKGTRGELDETGAFSVILPDGRTVRPGSRVEGAGGYVPAARWDEIPEVCVQSGEVAVFNARSSIKVEPGAG